MKKNIAVVGCGHWGKNLVRNFYELGVLHSICDPDTKISDQLSKQYGVKNSSFIEITNDPNIQGVVLAVPVKHHASMAIDAMKKGKHVFVEKPLSNSTEGLQQFKETVERNKVAIQVGLQRRFHPHLIRVNDIIKSSVYRMCVTKTGSYRGSYGIRKHGRIGRLWDR